MGNIKGILRDSDCFISGNKLEILSYAIPIDMLGTYKNAKQGIFMSATVNDDSFLIKGLGMKSGREKKVLIPSIIDTSLNRGEIVSLLGKPSKERTAGIVAVTPSFNSTKYWEKYGAIVATGSTIISEIESLKCNWNRTILEHERL